MTPINNFVRAATQDYELSGQTIRAGDKVILFWASGDRDEAASKTRTRSGSVVTRSPHARLRPHLCLGAHLARAEIEQMFSLLLSRMIWFQKSGPVERMNSSIKEAVKHPPIRYQLV